MNLLDIGGGFPAPYDDTVTPVPGAGRRSSTPSSTGSSRRTSRSSPSRAASWWPPPPRRSAQIIGKAVRDGKLCYYIDDGVYHTFSGIIFDHCQYHFKAFKKGPTQICSVFGPTCDALDTISLAEELPDLELGDLVYSRTSAPTATATAPASTASRPAKVVHVNQ